MATGLTIGGWFVSAFLDTVVDKVSSYALQQFGLQSGLHSDIQRLQTSLLKVQAVLVSAEKRQTKEENLSQLLKLLKDTAYDADDLLGEFEYQHLKLKVEGRGDQASGFLPSALNFASRLFDSDDAATKIREIQERLDTVTADLKGVLEVLGDFGENHVEIRVRPETSSLLIESDVFGRDEERDRVIELLLNSGHGSESSNRSVSVLPMVGIGGVGKTTLAQLVYHDPKVEDYFQLRIWVCVSEHFDVKRLTKEIIESVPGERHSDLTNLNRLQMVLQEKLISKRFLLVLDDVWNEDWSKWKRLIAPLRFGIQGSKILVTTRSQKVADIMGTMDLILLEGLSDDSYWSFFKRCAFGSQNSEKYRKLEAIGKKIADRLKGSPLAAKTLGGLLNSDLDEDHWRSIMDSEIWELQQDENDILPVLELSYRYLPARLKQCFAYCSLFRKDYEFDKESLVQMWIAQGFIAPQGNMRMEDVGSDYFYDLLCRSFFQQHSWKEGKYMMHDLLHDLAQSVSVDESLNIEIYDESQKMPSTLRHLSIIFGKLQLIKLMDWCKYKKLRTLVFIFGYICDLGCTLDDLLRELTSIRVLELHYLHMEELPESIGNLKQLRYLDISHSNILRLPESLCSLYNLQVLKVSPFAPVTFPVGMRNLINLKQLDADENSICQISEIGRLTSLQELSLFKVVKECGHMIGELKNMTELHRMLHISNLENVDSKEEASQAKLKNKKYLNKLCLEWAYNRHAGLEIDADVLEGLQPHHNLKELEIRSYGGVRYPSWLDTQSLSYLEIIHFMYCKSLEQLPSLGQLPFLKVLQFDSMHAVRQVGHEFYGTTELKGFPSLEELVFRDMPEWEEWCGAEASSQLFPHLRELCIKNCPKLRGLPCLPPTLENLQLRTVGLNALPEGIKNLINLRQLDVDEYMVSQITEIRKLTSLQELSIFKVVKDRGCMIGELKDMTELHGRLSISNLENVDSKEEASQAKLNNKKYLNEICLEWASDRHTSLGIDIPDADVLEGLQPHPNLKRLEIRSYGGFKCPSWLEAQLLSNLETVHLVKCKSLEQLPSIGHLPFLKVLRFESMIAVRNVGHEFYGTTEFKGFPSLKELVFADMPEWEEWFGAEASQLFPYLRELRLENCPKLRRLPCLPLSLTKLSLYKVGLNALPGAWVGSDGYNTNNRMSQGSNIRSSSLSVVFIDECPNLTSLEEWLLPNHLPAIKKMYIINCRELASLPVGRFKDLNCLEYLEMRDCPKLTSAMQAEDINLLHPSLRHLVLGCCGDLDMSLHCCLQNLTSLKHLKLIGCPHITTLPREILRHLTALQGLTIQDFAELKSSGTFQCLTSLKRLTILKCPRLTASLLPNEERGEWLPSLCSLHIDDTSLITLRLLEARLKSLQELEIRDSLQLTLFTEEEQKWLQKFTSLQILRFIGCPKLQSLPLELPTISTLRNLWIKDCPELKSLPDNGLPGSLTILSFTNCHPDLKERCRKDTGADWPKIAHVPEMHLDGELIS